MFTVICFQCYLSNIVKYHHCHCSVCNPRWVTHIQYIYQDVNWNGSTLLTLCSCWNALKMWSTVTVCAILCSVVNDQLSCHPVHLRSGNCIHFFSLSLSTVSLISELIWILFWVACMDLEWPFGVESKPIALIIDPMPQLLWHWDTFLQNITMMMTLLIWTNHRSVTDMLINWCRWWWWSLVDIQQQSSDHSTAGIGLYSYCWVYTSDSAVYSFTFTRWHYCTLLSLLTLLFREQCIQNCLLSSSTLVE